MTEGTVKEIRQQQTQKITYRQNDKKKRINKLEGENDEKRYLLLYLISSTAVGANSTAVAWSHLHRPDLPLHNKKNFKGGFFGFVYVK